MVQVPAGCVASSTTTTEWFANDGAGECVDELETSDFLRRGLVEQKDGHNQPHQQRCRREKSTVDLHGSLLFAPCFKMQCNAKSAEWAKTPL
jgi:hypothetical protein